MARCNVLEGLAALAATIVLLGGLGTSAAHATTYTWDNDSADGLWATNANWTPGTAPGPADTARLSTWTTPGTVGLGGANRTVNSISLENGSGSYTLQNGTLSLGSGLFQQTANVSGTNTMNATVSGAALNFAIGGGTLNVGGTGTIKGTTLTKSGPGTLNLSNTAFLTGATTISGGELILSGASGVLSGTTTGITVTMAKLTLDNSGTNNTDRIPDSTPITLQGGTLRMSSGSTSEHVGNLTISGTGLSRVIVNAGTLNLGGDTFTASTNGSVVDFSGAGTVSTEMSTTHNILSQRATINGADFIAKGSVQYPHPLYRLSGPMPQSGGSGSENYILTSGLTMTGNVAMNTLKIAPTSSGLVLNQGTNYITNGPYILFTGNNDFTWNGDWFTNAVSTTIMNYATQPLILNIGGVNGAGFTTFAGTGTTVHRSGAGSDGNTGYAVAGGTLKLGAIFADSKPWAIAGGTLDMSDTAAAGTAMTLSSLAMNAGTLTSSLGNPLQTLAGDITAGNGINVISNVSMTLGAARTLTVSDYQDTLNISSVINGTAYGITKAGNGNLILSNSDNIGIGGTSYLNAGKITLSNATGSALGTSNLVVTAGTLASGATGGMTGNVTGSGAAARHQPPAIPGRRRPADRQPVP